MLYRNGQEITGVLKPKESLAINQIYKKVNSTFEEVWSSTQWWEEYGVRAEYVIADGVTNFIETLLQIQSNLTIELDVEYLSVSGKERSLFGAANTNVNPRAVVEAGSITSGGKFFYGYSSNWHIVYDEIPAANRRYKLKYVLKDTEQVMYIDGVEVHRIADTKPGVPNALLMYLFARNINDTASNFVSAKLYGAKVTNDEGALLDYMPLYVTEKSITDANGTEYPTGRYILVDNVTKKATILNGNPLGGAILLPDWVYEIGTPIYGIKTSGYSWFVTDFDLGYTGKTVIKTIADNNASTKGLYGWYNSTNNTRIAIGIASSRWFAGKDNTKYGPSAVIGETVTITMDRDNNRFIVNDSSAPLTPVSSDVTHKAFLGHRSNTIGSTFSSPYIGIIQLWQEYAADGTLLRHSIPLIHKDGTVGIVDLVTRAFEGSATATPFEAVTDESVTATLSELGIEPTTDVEENIRILNEMGVII